MQHWTRILESDPPARWRRMIDSAQRRIMVESADGTGLMFQIQGMTLVRGELKEVFAYHDMADIGIRDHQAKPMRIWDRLRRRPAFAGDVVPHGEEQIRLTFWTKPPIEMVFDLHIDEEVGIYREIEILFLSAGYHFRIDPSLKVSA